MKKIISIFILTTMLLSTVLVSASDDGFSHSAIVGAETIIVKGQAIGATGLPITLKVSENDTVVYVEQLLIDDEDGFVFEIPLLKEGVTYTYALRHPRMSEVVSDTIYIASVSDETSVLNAFRNLNVGPQVTNRVSVMTEFLTTPLNAKVLNLNLTAFNALNNPSVVSEGMCDAFSQLTSLELISTKFAELLANQVAAETDENEKTAIIQDILAMPIDDMLDAIEANAMKLGAKTEYGFAAIKEAFDDGDTASAQALKDALQGVVTVDDFNKTLSGFAATVSFNNETWGQFDDIEQYYQEHIGAVFESARDTLNDLEFRTLKEAMQSETFADVDDIKNFISKKTAALVEARPKKKTNNSGGGGGRGGSQMITQGSYTPHAETSVIGFIDCEHVAWAKESIMRLKAEGIVNGKSATNFNPDDKTTREEFLKMLLLACGIEPKADGTTNFDDVAADSWCAPYIAKAVELGIVNGISDSSFGLGREITRQDMAVLCYRMLIKLNKQLSAEGADTFADAENIADYAIDAINAMQNAGIINGMGDNRFEPLLSATRAQTAVIIDRLINLQ